MTRRRLLIIAAVALLCGVVVFLPYKQWLEAKLRADIAASGLQVDFRLADVGLKGITLEDVTMAGQTLEFLSLGYTPREIIEGNFRKLDAQNIVLEQGKVKVNLSQVTLAISPDAGKAVWQGPWEVKAITVEGLPVLVPPLEGMGTLTRDAKRIALEGVVASADKVFLAEFSLDWPLEDHTKAVLVMKRLQLPWNGGMLKVARVSVPLFGKQPVRLVLNVQKVLLDTLMAGSTGNKANATGTISGSVPVVVSRDGSFEVQAGTLKADGAGTLVLSQELIPGDNASVQTVRDVLKDFHYDVFSMSIEHGDSKQLSMLLSLHGNNPAVYHGREINLNVRLTGDVIELLTQSAMMLQDPQQLLKEQK